MRAWMAREREGQRGEAQAFRVRKFPVGKQHVHGGLEEGWMIALGKPAARLADQLLGNRAGRRHPRHRTSDELRGGIRRCAKVPGHQMKRRNLGRINVAVRKAHRRTDGRQRLQQSLVAAHVINLQKSR